MAFGLRSKLSGDLVLEDDRHLQDLYASNIIVVTCESSSFFTKYFVNFFPFFIIKVNEVDGGLPFTWTGVGRC